MEIEIQGADGGKIRGAGGIHCLPSFCASSTQEMREPAPTFNEDSAEPASLTICLAASVSNPRIEESAPPANSPGPRDRKP